MNWKATRPDGISPKLLKLPRPTFVAASGASGAPNENIVQNHLNLALLNVFKFLNGRYRHIFIP